MICESEEFEENVLIEEVDGVDEDDEYGYIYRRKPLDEKVKKRVIQVLSIFNFFFVWQVICLINEQEDIFNPKFLPSPVQVIVVAIKYMMDGSLFEHLWASLVRVALGFLLGVFIALVLGVLITKYSMIDNIVSPILNLIGPIPVYAFLPIFIIWFGIGESSKVILIAYATFIPLMTYAIDGMRNVNPVWIRCAMSLGASEKQIFTNIIIKSALPNVFVGMKVSLGLTFSALVVAEMMGANSGLGFMIINARNWFKTGDIFLAIVLIGVLYSVFHGGLSLIERKLFKWKKNGINDAVD